jgi:hypothetical protein
MILQFYFQVKLFLSYVYVSFALRNLNVLGHTQVLCFEYFFRERTQ